MYKCTYVRYLLYRNVVIHEMVYLNVLKSMLTKNVGF